MADTLKSPRVVFVGGGGFRQSTPQRKSRAPSWLFSGDAPTKAPPPPPLSPFIVTTNLVQFPGAQPRLVRPSSNTPGAKSTTPGTYPAQGLVEQFNQRVAERLQRSDSDRSLDAPETSPPDAYSMQPKRPTETPRTPEQIPRNSSSNKLSAETFERLCTPSQYQAYHDNCR
eukprot:4551884-Pyramimonas_sp.AAC.1